MENKETLRAAGILHVLSDLVHHALQDLLAHGVVAPGEVVGGVLLARDETVRVLERLVGPGPELLQTTIFHIICSILFQYIFNNQTIYLIDDCWLQIHKDGSRHIFSFAGVRVEGCVVGILPTTRVS